MSYQEKLKDAKWIDLAARIRQRDGNMCIQCGSGGELHVHHSHYRQGREPWEYRQSDLFTLCKNCHEKNHGIELYKAVPPEWDSVRPMSDDSPPYTEIEMLRLEIAGYLHLLRIPETKESRKPHIFSCLIEAKKELEKVETARRESA